MSVTYVTVHGRLREETRGGVTTRYLGDTLGSVIKTTDESGNVTSETTYWPFGEVRAQTGTNPSPWGFCGVWGYLTDAVSRLYVRARHYRADTSRWLTTDQFWPWEQAYTYAADTPTSAIDPTGQFVNPGNYLIGPTLRGPTIGGAKSAYVGLITDLEMLFRRRRSCLSCSQHAREEADRVAGDYTKSLFPREMKPDGNTPLNAVNHCTSACWSYIQCGYAASDEYLNAIYEGWLLRGHPLDKHNNLEGFVCGERLRNHYAGPTDCAKCCMEQLRKGRLWH